MSTLVMQAAGGKSLGRIMSVVSLPAVLGPILGPVLGGLILQRLHWPWMFWINVPFCVVGSSQFRHLVALDEQVYRPAQGQHGVRLGADRGHLVDPHRPLPQVIDDHLAYLIRVDRGDHLVWLGSPPRPTPIPGGGPVEQVVPGGLGPMPLT